MIRLRKPVSRGTGVAENCTVEAYARRSVAIYQPCRTSEQRNNGRYRHTQGLITTFLCVDASGDEPWWHCSADLEARDLDELFAMETLSVGACEIVGERTYSPAEAALLGDDS